MRPLTLVAPGAILGTITASDLATYLAIVLSSTLLAAMWNARERRRGSRGTPGEGPAAAAEAVATGAEAVARSVDELLRPLRVANTELSGRVADLQDRLAIKTHELADALVRLADAQGELARLTATAANERHDLANNLAAAQAELARVKLVLIERTDELEAAREELVSTRIRLGDHAGRRADDDDTDC